MLTPGALSRVRNQERNLLSRMALSPENETDLVNG